MREQSLLVLVHLLENAGEIVTREDLRRVLWPSDTFVDFDHSLNAAVMNLRMVLGDSADAPLYIETIPKRGYRFIAPVARVANQFTSLLESSDDDRAGLASTNYTQTGDSKEIAGAGQIAETRETTAQNQRSKAEKKRLWKTIALLRSDCWSR